MNRKPEKPGKVSETLNVTDTTLRNYVKHFKKFLSPDATKRTGKRFSPEDVETLKTAKGLLDEGWTYEQVQERLESQPVTGEVIDESQPETEPQPDTSQEEPTPDEIPSAIQSIEFFSQVIEQLTDEHKTALTAKDNHIEELKTDKERLIQEKEQERLEKEKTQRQLNYERLPFYRQWFTEPPE